ncbi:protein adenylyltransferase SelO family protein, partial [Sulfitobacter sp.]
SNQPQIAVWNMAQLATALLPLLENSDAALAEATQIVHAMSDQIETAWRTRFAAKIGITSPTKQDRALIDDLLVLMQKDGADFTNSFRALSGDDAVAQFTDRVGFAAWREKWRARLAVEDDPEEVMNAANPVIIPRNHRIEEMIQAAVAGDMAPFNRLMDALASPFTATDPELHRPPSQDEIVPATFCGT